MLETGHSRILVYNVQMHLLIRTFWACWALSPSTEKKFFGEKILRTVTGPQVSNAVDTPLAFGELFGSGCKSVVQQLLDKLHSVLQLVKFFSVYNGK